MRSSGVVTHAITEMAREHCTWRHCITLFNQGIALLHGTDLDLMGHAFNDWIGRRISSQ